MKPATRTIIIAILLSIALFVIGMYVWVDIFTAALPVEGNIKYFSTSFTGVFINSTYLSLTLALIPIATILTWKFAPIITAQRKILTVCIIVITMLAAVLVRREMIIYKAKHLPPTTVVDYSDPANPQPKTVQSDIPLSSVKFELYVLAGLIAGTMISFFSLRQRTQ